MQQSTPSTAAWNDATAGRPRRAEEEAPLPLVLCWAIWIGATFVLWAGLAAFFIG
ncbi:MAG: hypothetical protein VX640_13285 [Pseudomonadota bacterium]|nr:hypothetical protein [Pseudomonadota bacterium]